MNTARGVAIMALLTTGCDSNPAVRRPGTPTLLAFCVDQPSKDDRIPCPAEVADLAKKDAYYWCFAFEDGWSGCGASKDRKAAIHDMVVDVACDNRYGLSGFPDREQPDPELGDPAVLAHSTLKLKLEGDECKVTEVCCEQAP